MKHFLASVGVTGFLMLTACGFGNGNQGFSSAKSVDQATAIVPKGDGTFLVVCKDGRQETVTKQELLADAVCHDRTTCQTAQEVREHLATKTTSPLVINGEPVADINNRFCVHKVPDSPKKGLFDKKAGPGDNPVLSGLLIAIADVDTEDNGATQSEAWTACNALTLLGKPQGAWRLPYVWNIPFDDNPKRVEFDPLTAESVGYYLIDDSKDAVDFIEWWTGSYRYFFHGFFGSHSTDPQLAKMGVRCIALP